MAHRGSVGFTLPLSQLHRCPRCPQSPPLGPSSASLRTQVACITAVGPCPHCQVVFSSMSYHGVNPVIYHLDQDTPDREGGVPLIIKLGKQEETATVQTNLDIWPLSLSLVLD